MTDPSAERYAVLASWPPDTEPDVRAPVVVDRTVYRAGGRDIVDEDMLEEETTAPEPIPAPVFVATVRGLRRAILAAAALVSGSILAAAWILR